MAKTSAIQRNLKRIKMAKKFANKRKKLKAIVNNKKLPLNERFAAQLKLSKLPKNSSKIRNYRWTKDLRRSWNFLNYQKILQRQE